MTFPARLLNEGEEVVVDVRPHPWALGGPVVVCLVVIAGTAAAASVSVPTAVAWILVGLLALSLVRLLARYLRWRATSLVVTTDRLVHRTGVLARSSREIPLAHLSDISTRQSVWARVIGTGDLVLESAGRDSQEVFAAIPHPAAVQNEIYRLMSSHRPGGPGRVLSVAEQLEKLADLRRRGEITDAEFEATKARLLHAP